jgi:Ser/Thr protein kinase RdoA (MazF antagonist)
MPAYGAFGADGIVRPVATNAEFVRGLAETAFERFLHFGGDPRLAEKLRHIVEVQFEAIVPQSAGAVFAHDDLHPGNVLFVERPDGRLELSGLIDFGNAQAADPVFDLAKCLFCSEHDAPGCATAIRAGYGAIPHPDPEAALWFYTLLHRVIMWWWLRHTGAIAADTPAGLLDDLWEMADG